MEAIDALRASICSCMIFFSSTQSCCLFSHSSLSFSVSISCSSLVSLICSSKALIFSKAFLISWFSALSSSFFTSLIALQIISSTSFLSNRAIFLFYLYLRS
ncbi:hypothetical protein KP509_16G031300 [Ceratopteris richardii]|uniref:Uncharacterized protein n=1 Tax=Ceratopteris richardii TaxID=49495 RepID=A0A8T2SXN0_CERRI|nr:hypothetical protein KP509_16G031300 [Ceratopteris richardii]